MKEVNKKIKEIREKKHGKGRTMSKFSKELDIPNTTYLGYEKEVDPPFSAIEKIFEITIKDLEREEKADKQMIRDVIKETLKEYKITVKKDVNEQPKQGYIKEKEGKPEEKTVEKRRRYDTTHLGAPVPAAEPQSDRPRASRKALTAAEQHCIDLLTEIFKSGREEDKLVFTLLIKEYGKHVLAAKDCIV